MYIKNDKVIVIVEIMIIPVTQVTIMYLLATTKMRTQDTPNANTNERK